jgi:glycosyltransferase involved in cell wall biosynthesis
MKPLFSIIIPSYNQGNFIAQTIESILNQSYKNVEVLVIDGGSTDNTIDVLKSYNNRIFWLSEKDEGQTHAINKGLQLAKGDIITYLNSDDYYLDGALEQVANTFSATKGTLWLTGDKIIVDEQNNTIHRLISTYKLFFRKRLSFNLLSVLNPIAQPSTFFTRQMIDKIGVFNEDLHYTMDYDFWMRAIKIQQPVVLKYKLSAFRVHKQSKGGAQFKKQFQEELVIAKKYQSNRFLIFIHYLHIKLIGRVYIIVK